MKKLQHVWKDLQARFRAIGAAAFSLCLLLSMAPAALATDEDEKLDFDKSKLVTGTNKLVEDATSWLILIAPIIGTVCIIYFAIRRGAADEQDQKQWENRIKTAVISVAIAVLSSVIIKLITSYYG